MPPTLKSQKCYILGFTSTKPVPSHPGLKNSKMDCQTQSKMWNSRKTHNNKKKKFRYQSRAKSIYSGWQNKWLLQDGGWGLYKTSRQEHIEI